MKGAVYGEVRLDVYLAEKGMAGSRTRALDLIKKGFVTVNGSIAKKASLDVDENDKISVTSDADEYVSRAALKLKCAKEYFKIDFHGLTAVDLGASTGGFCQIMLEGGINEVFAVDIGHGQLHERIAADERVHVLEGVNARYVDEGVIGKKVDIVSADLSFISQTLVFEAITKILKRDGAYIGLIKPQFEAGRERVGKHGIVKDARVHAEVIEKVIKSANAHGLVCREVIPSPILGGDGNREFLAYYINEGRQGEIPCRGKIERALKITEWSYE